MAEHENSGDTHPPSHPTGSHPTGSHPTGWSRTALPGLPGPHTVGRPAAARRKRRMASSMLLSAVAVLGAAAAALLLTGDGRVLPQSTSTEVSVATGVVTTTPVVTVPDDLVGLTEDEARTRLEQIDLQVRRLRLPGLEPEGRVLQTSPGPGAGVQAGSTVTLTVSTGPRQPPPERPETPVETPAPVEPSPVTQPEVPTTSIPEDLVGTPVRHARIQLQRAGFPVEVDRVDSDQPRNTVLAVEPGEGAPHQPGAVARLQVAR